MELVVRATAVYWFLWLVVRGTGKRSLSELTPLDFLLLVVIGDLVQQGVTQEDMSITGAATAISVFMAWTLLGDLSSRRSSRMSKWLSGEPVVIVRDGQILMDRMTEHRLSTRDLQEAARLEGISDFSEIEYAVLETDGRISFIRRAR